MHMRLGVDILKIINNAKKQFKENDSVKNWAQYIQKMCTKIQSPLNNKVLFSVLARDNILLFKYHKF